LVRECLKVNIISKINKLAPILAKNIAEQSAKSRSNAGKSEQKPGNAQGRLIGLENGAVEWNRTTDPVLTKDVLCP